jgi:type IV fimbrial biogenesis protein FimT
MRMRERGVTLVELVVVVVVLATLVAAAAPAYGAWLAELRLAAYAQQVATSMAIARVEAIRSGGRVVLCKAPAGTSRCTSAGGWDGGWLVFVDANDNAQADAAEPIVRTEPHAQWGITARGNQPVASYVSFTPFGQARLISGALQIGTITVCKPGLKAWQVVLASTGRVRMDRATAAC